MSRESVRSVPIMDIDIRWSSETVPRQVAAARSGALGVAGLLLVLSLALSACGAATAAAPLKTSAILTIDQATTTIHLVLAGSETNIYGGFNFDGYGGGAMRVRVPLGWTVDVDCKNNSTVLTHSCAVIDDLPISPYGGPIAFYGASTPNPRFGLPCGASATFSFVASKLGTFRIACLLAGHEADGMWDWLVVTKGGRPEVIA